IEAARMIFDELAGFNGRRSRVAELAEHRRELRAFELSDPEQASFPDLGALVDKSDKKSAEEGVRIDWQSLAVGFGAGLVIAFFGRWQIQEIRRRRQARAGRWRPRTS